MAKVAEGNEADEAAKDGKAAAIAKRREKRAKNDKNAIDESLAVPVLQIGDEVPQFTADSTMGMFNFHDLIDGAFSIVVTFRNSFDPVSTTEIGMLAKLKEEFKERDVRVLGLCVDTKDNLRKWTEEIQELQDCGDIWFPIICDTNADISRLFGLVKNKAVNAKRNLKPATLIMMIDIDKRVRLVTQYPETCGRNFYESLRSIDSLQLTLFHRVVTPVNWFQGEEVFVHPDLSSNAASSMFPKGFNEVRPWYRPTTQPDVSGGL